MKKKIEVLAVLNDRVLLELFLPRSPQEGELPKDLNEYPLKGRVFMVGGEVEKYHPLVRPGNMVMIDSLIPGRYVCINDKRYWLTKANNVSLVYKVVG